MRTLLALAIAGSVCAAQESSKGGQEKTSFEKLTFPFEGEVTATNLYVRLAPKSDPTSPPATVLRQGARVTVVGEKDDFFQILPPQGCFVWIYSKSVKRDGDSGIVTSNETPVRTDSRVGADKLAVLNEGAKVKILGEHMGWYKIEAPEAVKYFVGRKYVKKVGDAKTKDRAPKPEEDAAALAKIREAETLIAEVNKFLEAGELEKVDFDGIVALFDEAAALAKSESVKKEAETGARNYRGLQTIWNMYKAQREDIKRTKERIREEQERMRKPAEKKFAFAGYVDCTSWSMPDRPGTHRLMVGEKTVCFLKFKDGDTAMLKKLNDNYKRYVGVNGTVIKDPKGWEGYSVVVVEEICPITK
ncbi:MAG: SH3 domain-containing protein [Planctomycetes bacterium]|nr:SH3 domain-containing protein [Planctomycetota bacterium]